MATQFTDVAGPLQALSTFAELYDTRWKPETFAHKLLLRWGNRYRAELDALRTLPAGVSREFTDVLPLVERYGITAKPQLFDQGDVLLVSDFSMKIRWPFRAAPAMLRRGNSLPGPRMTGATYKGLFIEPDHVEIFDVRGWRHPLIHVSTSTCELWLIKAVTPNDWGDMLVAAKRILEDPRIPLASRKGGVIMPTLKFDINTTLDWMFNLQAAQPNNINFMLTQAYQHCGFECGPNALEAEPLPPRGAAPTTYVLNEPFYCVVADTTSPRLPRAVLWLDTDSWEPCNN